MNENLVNTFLLLPNSSFEKENESEKKDASAYNGAIRLFGDVKKQNELLRKTFDWIEFNVQFQIEDAFGNHYSFDNRNNVLIFYPDGAEITNLNVSDSDFFYSVENYPNDAINLKLFQQLTQDLGEIENNMHFSNIVSLCVGGKNIKDNFHILPREDNLDALATITRQIKDVPAGTRFRPYSSDSF